MAWQVARSLIDRGLARIGTPNPRADRLATVLPALRTVVLVALIAHSRLSAWPPRSVCGSGPLLAGCGRVGLTIGFGAQALVRDVIAGFFLLLDDAFRVGERSRAAACRVGSRRSRSLGPAARRQRAHAHGGLRRAEGGDELLARLGGAGGADYVPHGVPYEAAAGVITAAIAAVEADEELATLLTAPPAFLVRRPCPRHP